MMWFCVESVREICAWSRYLVAGVVRNARNAVFGSQFQCMVRSSGLIGLHGSRVSK